MSRKMGMSAHVGGCSGFSTRPWWKKVGIRIPTCWNCFAVSSIFEQTLIEVLSSRPCWKKKLPDLAQKILNAIAIVIAIVIRINRTLLENFSAAFAWEMVSLCGWDEADAEKICRLLEECWCILLVSRLWWVSTFRYAFTCTRTCRQAVAQRGVDRPPSDSEHKRGGGGIATSRASAHVRKIHKRMLLWSYLLAG